MIFFALILSSTFEISFSAVSTPLLLGKRVRDSESRRWFARESHSERVSAVGVRVRGL